MMLDSTNPNSEDTENQDDRAPEDPQPENEAQDEGESQTQGESGRDPALNDVLVNLDDAARHSSGNVSVGDVLDEIGSTSHGPLLLVPGLLALFPLTGAIPGMSVFTGTWILIVAIQMLLAGEHIWLPRVVRDRSISEGRLRSFQKKLGPWIDRLSQVIGRRVEIFARHPFSYVLALVCALMALTMFPLALVPGGAAAPAGVVVLVGLALTARDGILSLLAIAGAAATGFLTYTILQ